MAEAVPEARIQAFLDTLVADLVEFSRDCAAERGGPALRCASRLNEEDIMHDPFAYWRQQLQGATQPELPTDRRRGAAAAFSAAVLPLDISPALCSSIHRLSREESTTPQTILAAALQTFVFRHTGESDVLIGVSSLPLRCDVTGPPTFRELLRRVSASLDEAGHHRNISASALAAMLQAGEAAPFAVTLAYEDEAATPGADLSVSLRETPQGLSGSWQYNAELFDAATAVRMADHFLILLAAAVADPDEQPARLPLLSAAERQQLVVDWNQTQAEYPRDRGIHDLFEEQAALHPDRIAVVFQNEQLTYRELNVRANRLAHRLRSARRGAGRSGRHLSGALDWRR